MKCFSGFTFVSVLITWLVLPAVSVTTFGPPSTRTAVSDAVAGQFSKAVAATTRPAWMTELPAGLETAAARTLVQMMTGSIDDYIRVRTDDGIGVPKPARTKPDGFWKDATLALRGALPAYSDAKLLVLQGPLPAGDPKSPLPDSFFERASNKSVAMMHVGFSSLRTDEALELRKNAGSAAYFLIPGIFPLTELTANGGREVVQGEFFESILLMEFIYNSKTSRWVNTANGFVGVPPGQMILPPFP